MQLRRLLVIAAMAVTYSLSALPAQADQPLMARFPHLPLLMGIRQGQRITGNIWAWDNSPLIQRTGGGLSFVPIVSPMGDSYLYLRIPTAYDKRTSPDQDRPAARDIYLANLSTGQATAIAAQPKNASFADSQAHYTLRSAPNWSPDGKLMAWTELTIGPATSLELQPESLVLYDVTTKTAHTLIPELPAHRVVAQYPALSEVSLGPGGLIAVRVHVSADIDSSGQDWLYFYDTAGKQIARLEGLEAVEQNYEYSQLIWLSGLDMPYLSCVACTSKINPRTGSIDTLNGTPELYSALAPDRLSVYYGADSGDESNVTWIIALNGKQVSKFASVRIANLRDVAIAPDGMQVASANYVGQGTTAGVFIYQAQRNRMVKVTVNVIGLGWWPMAWRVRANPAQ
jgi:hypothetical protein